MRERYFVMFFVCRLAPKPYEYVQEIILPRVMMDQWKFSILLHLSIKKMTRGV